MKTVGFAGLGRIGLPMARNLLGKGWEVLVYDIREEACTELAEQGAEVAASPAVMASRCEHIGVCVRDDDDVEAVFEGVEGLLAGARPGDSAVPRLIVSLHSTISPATIRSTAKRAAKLGVHVIDAPIGGGVDGATNATLTTMVGATRRCSSVRVLCSSHRGAPSSTAAPLAPAWRPSSATTSSGTRPMRLVRKRCCSRGQPGSVRIGSGR